MLGDQISLIRAVQTPQPVSFTAEPEALCVDMTRSALIVIDMQNDFLDPAGWLASVRGADVSQLSDVIPRINDLSAVFRLANAPVIHLNWGVRADLANLPANVVDKGSACGRTVGYGNSIESGDVQVIVHERAAEMLESFAVDCVLMIKGSEVIGVGLPATQHQLIATLAKAEASSTGLIRGSRHTMLDDSDISPTRHARGFVGGLLGGLIGNTEFFVPGGAEHQGPDGGGPFAIIYSE